MTRSIKKHSWFVSFLIMSILLSTLALPTDVVHAINTPWLTVSGRFIRDPQGNNVVLRGVSLTDVSVADSRPRNARLLIDMVTDDTNSWYARVVRVLSGLSPSAREATSEASVSLSPDGENKE